MSSPLFSLGARLAACAGLVRPQTALADIGTDHAYLPVWLAAQGRIKSAVAADVRPGPLERAKANITRCRVGDVVTPRLSDGLDSVKPEEAEDVVIAGMGGLLMARIIGRTPWLKDGGRRLILQPMTSAEDLRLFLSREGYAVLREFAVREQRHLYTVLLCVYDPPNRMTGALFPYVGQIRADTPENRAYLRGRSARLAKRIGGLRAENKDDRAEELSQIRDEIEGMLLRGAKTEKENDL